MNLQQIKQAKQDKVDQLIKDCSLFFAFSNEQFEKNKTPLEEGEKYVSIGMGGYMPKGKVDEWIKGMDEVETWYKSALKDNKLRKANIADELVNHEAYYTGRIDDTLDALGEDYTESEVMEVFKKERKKQYS